MAMFRKGSVKIEAKDPASEMIDLDFYPSSEQEFADKLVELADLGYEMEILKDGKRRKVDNSNLTEKEKPEIKNTVYDVYFMFLGLSRKVTVRTLKNAIDGFWIDEAGDFTQGSDAGVYIPAGQILHIEKSAERPF